MMYGFHLGREFKLSIAELLTVFPNGRTVYSSKEVLILEGLNQEEVLEKAIKLGGTIKIMEVTSSDKTIQEHILDSVNTDGKFKYGLSIFGEKNSMREILIKIKKELKAGGISSRFINKDFKNLSSAQILGEGLVKRESDFSYIMTSEQNYFCKSIWVQDIESYSKRDYDKDRDMQIGMLPPKLSQMMINLSEGTTIYDPFVGLGTILIESAIAGNTNVYGSDLNEKMVETSYSNLVNIKGQTANTLNINISKLNAKFIEESEYFNDKNLDAIVTEGYLGEIMTKKNIAKDRILKQRESLTKTYEAFFAGLTKIQFKGNIVISFPFWEFRGVYQYFDEIYEILNKNCEILPFFPTDYEVETTKMGSLLYKRKNQLVGREIFKLKIK